MMQQLMLQFPPLLQLEFIKNTLYTISTDQSGLWSSQCQKILHQSRQIGPTSRINPMLIFPKYQFYLWIFHTENDLSSVQVLGITLLDQQCLQPFSHWCVSICQALVWVNCKKLALLNSIIHWDCPDFHHHRATTRWVAMKARKLANYLTVSQNWICCCKTKPTMTWTLYFDIDARHLNFFHEAFTMIIAKLQYLHTRRKLWASPIEHYHFPVAHSLLAEVTSMF